MPSHSRRHSLCEATGPRSSGLRALIFGGLVAVVALLGSCQSGDPAPDETFEQFVGSAPKADKSTPPARRGALWYQIEVRQERLEVHARLLDPPERTSFFLPGPWAGRRDFADNISIKGAASEDGPVPFTISRSEGRIDVESKGARWVQLDYAVELRRKEKNLQRFHPQLVDQVLFAYGPAFIVLPSEQISRQVRDIPIEVRAPADWKLVATWKHIKSMKSGAVKGSSVHGFMASTPGALRDAFVAAGPGIEVRTSQVDDEASPLSVGFAPSLEIDRATFTRRVEQLVGAYRQRFGDLGAVSAFVRAVESSQTSQRRGVGRRGGFVVELPAKQPLDDKTLLLLAHEAFHLWNGHYLTPEPAAEQSTRWFKEGVTHYVALKMLAELGLFERDDVLRELARAASYYQRNPAAKRKASSKTDRARLPYDKGVLLGLALDAALLGDTNGRVGLQDWMSALVETRGGSGNGYDADDLRATLAEVAGSATAPAVQLWDAHAAGAQPLDPAQVFDLAGLHWLERSGRTKTRLLPVKREHSPFRKMFPQ